MVFTEAMRRSSWCALGARVEKRFIRVVDLLSIFVLDAVILLAGYALIWVVDTTTGAGDAYFEAARALSEGAFLPFCVAWVGWDPWELARNEDDQ